MPMATAVKGIVDACKGAVDTTKNASIDPDGDIPSQIQDLQDQVKSDMADKFTKAIVDWLKEGVLSPTVDTGTMGSNPYTGAGTPISFTPKDGDIKSGFVDSMDVEDENEFVDKISTGIANGINNGECKYTTKGVATPPTGSPIPVAGVPTKGKITVQSSILKGLLTQFIALAKTMGGQASWAEQGDQKLAEAICNGTKTMCAAGVIALNNGGSISPFSGQGVGMTLA